MGRGDFEISDVTGWGGGGGGGGGFGGCKFGRPKIA